jgi:hypothetical protein
MKRTVPSRPLSPMRPARGVPLAGAAALGAVDVGVGGWTGVTTSFGDTSLGDGLLPFDSRPLPLAAGFGFLGSFHSVKRGRCFNSTSSFNLMRTLRNVSTANSGPTTVLVR